MTRQFHARIRRVPRATTAPTPGREREHVVAFTCFRLVPIPEWDREPGEPAFHAIELCDPGNSMRALVLPPKG